MDDNKGDYSTRQEQEEQLPQVQAGRRLITVPWLTGALSVFTGGFVLAGWAFDPAVFHSILPGWSPMKANTALGFTLAGIALLVSPYTSFRLPLALTRLCALLCGLIGLLTLGEYLFTWNPGFDLWLFSASADLADTVYPGRMAPDSAISFVLLGAGFAVACGAAKTRMRFLGAAIFSALIMAMALATLFSIGVHLGSSFDSLGLPRMTFHTAVLFFLLSTAIVQVAKPEEVTLWSLSGKTAMGLALWSLLAVGSLSWSLHQQGHHLRESATVAARANINKDLSFRRWATSHGGVYVPPTEHTPPNPYLKVPDRDVVTTSGKALTLMNPAYMMRQMQQNFGDEYGTRSSITSLKPLNPENTPDAWQAKALTTLAQGGKELLEIKHLHDQPYMRLMLPIFVEFGCLKCHAHQGYKLGDIRGGIDTSISLTPFLARARERNASLLLSHGMIWLLGVSGLLLFYRREQYLEELNQQAEEEKRKLEAQLRQAQKMEAIGTLAGGIAHDFNNILSIIFGYNELAMLENDPQSRRQHLEELRKGAQRAKELVAQILAFSRKTEQQMQPLQVALIVKEALKMLRASLPVTIEIKQDIASYAMVLADPTQIHQLIMNLCTNAYHAMRDTGGTLAVSLTEAAIGENDYGYASLAPGNYLKLDVSDTGHGIEPQLLGKIFEPYFTTKKVGEGTGMGLAVVHGIVKSHHGHITVYSEPGKGASFHVYLPLTDQEIATTPETAHPEELRGKGERILFVDDEEQIRTVMAAIFNQHGYRITTFANGTEALQAFQDNPGQFDLVITDMTMPAMTGAELAQKILAVSPRTPVILCTGQSALINREKAFAIGVREYLNKPVQLEVLLRAARKALEKT